VRKARGGDDDLVTQLSFVFHDDLSRDGTIAENALLARPEATADQLDDAVPLASVDEIVARLPDGVDIASARRHQAKLMGGERQRFRRRATARGQAECMPCPGKYLPIGTMRTLTPVQLVRAHTRCSGRHPAEVERPSRRLGRRRPLVRSMRRTACRVR
jgi:hypothetical protein